MATLAELKTFTESIIEASLSDDIFYGLMTAANDILEGEREWEYLTALDETLSVSSSDSYTTSKTLPENFIIVRSLYVGSDTIPYEETPFEHRELNKNRSRTYYIDYAQNKLYLVPVSTGTIHLWFKKATGDIDADTTLRLPTRYQRLLAIYTAGVFQGAVDWDGIAARMSGQNLALAKALKDAMILWDATIQSKKMNYSRGGYNGYISPNDYQRLDTNS